LYGTASVYLVYGRWLFNLRW